MDIDFERSNGIAFIKLDGNVTADNCMEVRDMIMESLTVNKRFLLDLSKVDYMDSVSVGTFMSLAREVSFMDGDIRFTRPHKTLKSTFKCVRADEVLSLYDTLKDALIDYYLQDNCEELVQVERFSDFKSDLFNEFRFNSWYSKTVPSWLRDDGKDENYRHGLVAKLDHQHS